MREEWEAVKQPHLSMGQAETALPHPEQYLRQAYKATQQGDDSLYFLIEQLYYPQRRYQR